MAQRVVTPDPIADPIRSSGIKVELDYAFQVPASATTGSLTRVNFTYHADDGSGRIFSADSRGKIWIFKDGAMDPQPLLDMSGTPGFYHDTQAGLRSFAFHPDFERAGTAGYGKLYTLSTHSLASAPAGVKVFEANGDDSFVHDVITEWKIRADDPTRIDMGSRREILRVEELLRDHNADQIMFNPNARPGQADYGKLYFGTGDGGNYFDRFDPFNNAQDPGSALGKILRFDPLDVPGDADYGVPADNPFIGNPEILPEIWATGLRHPTNFSFDMGGTGQMLIADIGQANIEEINLGKAGANYGWDAREGTFATVQGDESTLLSLPDNDGQFGYAYPVLQFDRSEEVFPGKLAVTGGYVYRGTAAPELVGHYIFGDIVSGRVFHAKVSDLQQGRQTAIQELTLLENGKPVTMLELVKADRADIRFGQDENGEVYITNKRDGIVRMITSANGGGQCGEADIALRLGETDTGSYGNRFNGQTDADGVIKASFTNTGGDARLSLTGYDIDYANEVRVLLNGKLLGFLKPGANDGLNAGDSFEIDATAQISGTNILTFEQAISDGYKWGVTNIRLERVDSGGADDLSDLFPSVHRVGSAHDDILNGTSLAELIDADSGNDTQHGYGGNDFLVIGAGNDKNFGGSGLDVALFDGELLDFSGVSGVRDVYNVKDLDKSDGDLGADRIKAVELFVFDDAIFDTRTGKSESFADGGELVQRLEDLLSSADTIV